MQPFNKGLQPFGQVIYQSIEKMWFFMSYTKGYSNKKIQIIMSVTNRDMHAIIGHNWAPTCLTCKAWRSHASMLSKANCHLKVFSCLISLRTRLKSRHLSQEKGMSNVVWHLSTSEHLESSLSLSLFSHGIASRGAPSPRKEVREKWSIHTNECVKLWN